MRLPETLRPRSRSAWCCVERWTHRGATGYSYSQQLEPVMVDGQAKPSPKQIEYAKILADRNRLTIPPMAYESFTAASKFIESCKKMG